jgi:anti-anti-sigma factor
MTDAHLRTSTQGSIVHATVTTEQLADERTCDAIAASIEQAVTADTPNCVLDLANVTYCTSTGIGAMIRAHNACKDAGGRLAIINTDPNIAGALKVAKLDRLFKFAKDADAARKALS